ncbi:MAG: hypothetical protein GY867_04480, partial [bacterium]|nr:hypothetical protein [bacterium]
MADGFPHNWFLVPLYDAMRRHLGKLPATLVTFSTVLVLGDGKNSSPDVAVIKGDVDRSVITRAVKLRDVGGRLVFALEAVSTSAQEVKDKDLKKNVQRYAEEGVAEYLTVFPILERRVKDLVGRRLSDQGEYDEIPPDSDGRVYSEQLGLYFYIDESEELVAVDAETGQQLRLSDEEEERAERAEERAEQEAEARQKAEAEKQKVEAEKQTETAARQKAEAEKQKVEAEKQKETAARQKA